MSAPFTATVYIITSLTSESEVEKMFTGITSSMFSSNPVKIPMPTPNKHVDTKINACGRRTCNGCRRTHIARPATLDYEIFTAVAANYALRNATDGVVIIKDTTVTPGVSLDIVEFAINSAISKLASRPTPEVMDVFYLAKWLDIPNKFEKLDLLPGGGHVVKTWSPHGFQALVFTNTGFDKLLKAFPPDKKPVVCRPFSEVMNLMIQNGALIAATTTPSLMQYDTYLTGDPSGYNDSLAPYTYLKSCEARGDIGVDRPQNRRISSDLTMFWFIIVVLVTFITTWTLVNLGAMVV